MIDRTNRMSGAEFRALRESLGLTGDHLARLLGVGPRQARRWEQGGSPIPVGVTRELGVMLDETAAEVERLIAAHPVGKPLVTYRGNDSFAVAHPGSRWSASWHRAVVARVLHARPDLTIAYGSD